jgi:hypothetical protein
MTAPQPFNLRASVSVKDIAFVILKIPRDNYKEITFPDPDFLFYLSLDSSHPCHTIETPDANMVCTHHELGTAELFTVAFLGKSYTDNLITRSRCRGFFFKQNKPLL